MSGSTILFPQAYLVYQQAYKRKENQIKESDLKTSTVKVAKLKGNYKTEAVVSKIFGSLDTKQNKVEKSFLNMQTHKISALVPEIRLFKVLKEGNSKKSIPFYFPVTADYDLDPEGRVNLKTRSFSAGAAVIENFSFSFQGRSPYSLSRKFMKASLTIKVDNIGILFEKRPGYAPLADLFTIGAGNRSQQIAGFSAGFSQSRLASLQSARIGATIGYSVPRNYELFSSDEITSIESSRKMLNLTYSTHDLSLSDDGSATVTINYTGHLESFKDASQFNLLSGPITKASLELRKTQQRKTAGKINKLLSPKQKKQNPKAPKADEVTPMSQEDIKKAFTFIIEDLYENNKIHKISFDKSYFEAKTTSELLQAPEARRQQSIEAGTATAAKTTDNSSRDKNPLATFDKETIHYFTFGDFMQSYFNKIENDLKQAKKINNQKNIQGDEAQVANTNITGYIKALEEFNILLADVTATTNKFDDEGAVFTKNIADIPISLDNFYTSVYKQIRKPGLMFYDLYSFTDGFAKDLLQRSFDNYPEAKFIKDVTFSVVTYTSSKLRAAISKGEINIKKLESPNQFFSKKSIEESEEYIVFVQEPSNHAKAIGSGNSKNDSREGIFHLALSKDRGLVKNISFSKISSPSREAALVAVNADMYDELRIPHNATISMVGNFMFMPLCQVYVDPNSIGFGSPKDLNSAARRLGFGGYYTVTDVTTTFSSAGKLDTKLSLNFVSFPETKSEPDLPFGTIDSINSVSRIGN